MHVVGSHAPSLLQGGGIIEYLGDFKQTQHLYTLLRDTTDAGGTRNCLHWYNKSYCNIL